MTYYFAAWTDSGFLLGCDHKHNTVTEAVACISCAGGYVIAVGNGVYRALNDVEEREFESTPRPALSSPPAEVEYEEVGYAVMVRAKFVDGWGWDTWMRFDTHEEASAHAREGSKVVAFGSAEWIELMQVREAAPPLPARECPGDRTFRTEEETLFEFVSRIVPPPLDQHGQTENAGVNRRSDACPRSGTSGVTMTPIEFVLDWLDRWEVAFLERIYGIPVPSNARTLSKRLQKVLARS